MQNKLLFEMLLKDAEAQRAKALLTLDLLGNKAVCIGDHSTGDFYDNAKEALSALQDADDQNSTLMKYFSSTSAPGVS